MCPICIVTIGSGILITYKLGVISLVIFVLTVLVTMKVMKDKDKNLPKTREGDMFGEFNVMIKKILHCCGK